MISKRNNAKDELLVINAGTALSGKSEEFITKDKELFWKLRE